MQIFLQNDKINVIKSPRVKALSSEPSFNEISSNKTNLMDEEQEEIKVKNDTGPEIKVITEVVSSGVIIEHNENNEFLNKLKDDQNEEEDDEEDD